ncbi:MAG TPA: hypothetical protein VJX23_13525 [Candidatus Binataceae bacterium]|nr:hypothetical protein [Candidatus Binataceae bacterium]
MNHTSVADKLEQKRLRHGHQHPPLINVNEVQVEALMRGQRVADSLPMSADAVGVRGSTGSR